MTEVEVGKLYVMVYGGLYECMKVEPKFTYFRRITIDPSYLNPEYKMWTLEVMHEVVSEATLEDINNSIQDCRDAIGSLQNEIDNYKGSIRDLDEWRDRAE